MAKIDDETDNLDINMVKVDKDTILELVTSSRQLLFHSNNMRLIMRYTGIPVTNGFKGVWFHLKGLCKKYSSNLD